MFLQVRRIELQAD